jgi:hypothetical protein
VSDVPSVVSSEDVDAGFSFDGVPELEEKKKGGLRTR